MDKVYEAEVEGDPDGAALARLREGVELEDGRTAPAEARRPGPGRVELTIHEGRKHQVKRMLETVGHPVCRLHRSLYAGLDLAEPGRTELSRLATGCRAAASRAGIAVDGKRFHAHLTVARCGRPTEVTAWVRLLDGYRGPAWRADRLTLVASHLGEGPRRRPRYEEVGSFPLGRD